MIASNHTPAPWYATYSDPEDASPDGWLIEDEGVAIAFVFDHTSDPDIDQGLTPAEAAANARLIAAAPELLAMFRVATHALCPGVCSEEREDQHIESCTARRALLAHIAGGTP